MNTMKLTEAVDYLCGKTNNRQRSTKRLTRTNDITHFSRTGIELYGATGGMSSTEEWFSQLQDSYFGHRFLESTLRGGGYTFFISNQELKENREEEWFTLIAPHLELLQPFAHTDDQEVVTRHVMRLEYGGPRRSHDTFFVTRELRNALTEIIVHYGGRDALVELLAQGHDIEAKNFSRRNQYEDVLKIAVTLHDHPDKPLD